MLTDKDVKFIARWESVRLKESTFSHKLFAGLPMAMLFSLPILFFFIIVKVFFPEWFTTATHKQVNTVVPEITTKFMKLSTGDIVITCISVALIVLFYAYFRMHYKWEMNEQLYNELKNKKND